MGRDVKSLLMTFSSESANFGGSATTKPHQSSSSSKSKLQLSRRSTHKNHARGGFLERQQPMPRHMVMSILCLTATLLLTAPSVRAQATPANEGEVELSSSTENS